MTNVDPSNVPTPSAPGADSLPGLVRLTHIIYGLHAFSVLTGILGAATVVGAFLIGWPSLIGVILNYVKRPDVRGTFLDSHFRWQIRTFWFGLLWAVLIWIAALVTFGLALVFMIVLGVWFAYRVIRGWLALNERRPMYA